MNDRANQYIEMLGLRPGASWDEVNTTYYMLIENFPENPTEEEEEALKQIQQAYTYLRRTYQPPRKKTKIALSPKLLVPMMAVLLVVLAATLLILRYQDVRLMIVEYQEGDVLRWRNGHEPYGQIMQYDPEHKFHAGPPAGAYQIRLSDKDETIWLSERIVVKAMVPIESGDTSTAGVGGSSQ